MLKWFKEEFRAREVVEAVYKSMPVEELMSTFLKEVPTGSMSLIVLPYWTPNLETPEAQSAMIGFSGVHTKAHVYKAIIEGLGYVLLNGKNKIEKAGRRKIRNLTVSDGGAQSDEICLILSDIFNLPLRRGETHKASELEAAIDAFMGLGVHEDFKVAVDKMIRYADTFYPMKELRDLRQNVRQRLYSHVPVFETFVR